jgi:hypothetical protein
MRPDEDVRRRSADSRVQSAWRTRRRGASLLDSLIAEFDGDPGLARFSYEKTRLPTNCA